MTAQVLSWYALWAATALYAIAMIASSIHLARVADARVQARAEAVAVGATGPARSGAGSDALGARPSEPSPVATPLRTKAAGIARSAMLVGVALNAVGVIARGIEAAHVPWSNMYGYAITGALVAMIVLLIIQRRRDVAYLVPLVTGLAALSIGLALRFLYEEATGLVPALQSFWIIIHVSIAIVATGVFVVAAAATFLQLMRDYRAEGEREVTGGPLRRAARRWHNVVVRRLVRWNWLEAVPQPTALEGLAFRLHAVGFVLWTFTLISGAVWAEHAWGRYWGWDPKEVWTFVIWVIYAAYLHARTTQGWAGRRSAYLAIGGFVALILNFTVVNFVFQGLHSYAG